MSITILSEKVNKVIKREQSVSLIKQGREYILEASIDV